MVDKYVGIDASGTDAEVAFKQTSAGAADAGKGVGLNSAGKIDDSMLPSDSTNSITASEGMTAPAMVNVHSSSGAKVRYADASAASAAKRVTGYIVDNVLNAAAVNVYFGAGDIVPGLSGLTPGADYFLSGSTPGAITATPVTASGQILQKVGTAVSATELRFEPGEPIIRA